MTQKHSLQAESDAMLLTEEVALAWLENTEAGEALVRRVTDMRLAGRVSILIVCHADGFLEVYHDKQASVHCVNMLNVQGLEATTLAEEYLELLLPRKFKRMLQRHPRTLHKIDDISPYREYRWREWQDDLNLFKAISEVPMSLLREL